MKEKNSLLPLNDKDLIILQKLIEDGRKTSSKISKEIDLGKEVINYRIKKLIRENLILKFIPKINKSVLNYNEYIILLKLNLKDNISKEDFIKKTIGNKYLIWSVKSNSGWDIIIRLYCYDVEEFKTKLNEILESLQNIIARYYTIMSTQEIKENEKKILIDKLFNGGSKKDFENIKNTQKKINLDDKDKAILNLLEKDGRVQYSDISNKLSISSDTVKYRIDKMLKENVIENFNPIINFSKIGFIQSVMIVKFTYLNLEKQKNLKSYIEKNEFIIKAIKNLNNDEYFLNLISKRKEDTDNTKNDLEKLFSKELSSIECFFLD